MSKRYGIVFLLMVVTLVLSYEVRINCGATEPFTFGDNTWEADVEYSEGGYGYIDGHQIHGYHTLGNSWLGELYRYQRAGLSEYRFDLPNGDYIVKLAFAEKIYHRDNMRVMDIEIEDSFVLRDFDPHSYRGKDFAIDKVFLISVTDGQLNIKFTASTGIPSIAGITVRSAHPDSAVIRGAGYITVASSYDAMIVRIPFHPITDYISGYHVYRSEGSSFERVTDEPILRSYIDENVEVGDYYSYYIAAVDVFGNECYEVSPRGPKTPLDRMDCALPSYEILIDPSDLYFLQFDPLDNTYVRAHFVHNDNVWHHVRVRFRGNSLRHAPKKSWLINFRSERPFYGLNKVNLNSEYYDLSILRNLYGVNLFSLAGIDAPFGKFATLWINGKYEGLFIELEQIDEVYLSSRGYSEGDHIYMNEKSDYSLESVLHEDWDNKTGDGLGDPYAVLDTFIKVLHNTPDTRIEVVLDSILDIEPVLRYLAVITLIGDYEFASHNHYLHRVSSTGRWHIIPWDLNLSFYRREMPLGIGSFFAAGYLTRSPNILFSRIFAVDNYRNRYVDLLDSLSLTLFSTETVNSYVDSLVDYMKVDAFADYQKGTLEHNSRFLYFTEHLVDVLLDRVEFVRSQLDDFRAFENPTGIFINELCVNNYVYPDDFLEYDPFVELYNAGDEPFDIGNLYLTDEPFSQHKWRLPSFELPPGEFIIIWLDNQPEQGPFHSTLEVDSTGGFIGLFDGRHDHPRYLPAVDLLFYGEFVDGRSWQRYPDGGNEWSFADPTPRSSNIHQVAEDVRLPDQLLVKAFPNPFNSSVSVDLPSKTETLLIFDTRGKQIAEFKGINSVNSVVWSPSDELSSGLYLLRAISQSGREISRAKVVYIK